MDVLVVSLLILAAACLVASASGRIISTLNLTALGLFFWVLAQLFPALSRIL